MIAMTNPGLIKLILSLYVYYHCLLLEHLQILVLKVEAESGFSKKLSSTMFFFSDDGSF